MKSDWVRAELHWAMENRKGRVVPLLLKPCQPADLHIKLPLIQHIDLQKDCQSAWKMLLSVWGRDRQRPSEPDQEFINLGLSVEWTIEGPRLVGNSTVISPLEWTALFNRYLEIYDSLCAQGGELEAANIVAVIKACEQTYKTTIYEDDLKDLESEIGRKADLFFKHVMALWEGTGSN